MWRRWRREIKIQGNKKAVSDKSRIPLFLFLVSNQPLQKSCATSTMCSALRPNCFSSSGAGPE